MVARILRLTVLLVVAVVEIPASATEPVMIRNVPHIAQKPDFCGEACVSMALAALGVKVDQDAVFDHSGLDPLLGRGCYTPELVRAVRDLGFDPGPVWLKIDPARADEQIEQAAVKVERDLVAGRMAILCTRFDDTPQSPEHFRLFVGYDRDRQEFLYHDPAIPQAAYQRMSRAALKALWPLKYQADEWTLVLISLKPDRLPKAEGATRFTAADYAQHIHHLRSKLPPGFHVRIEEPFVVVGDEEPETVDQRSRDTVRWAVDRIRRDYFSKDPDEVITVWLFRDSVSYETHAEKLFGRKPTTPYGYYSPTFRALVMNISTGGGTLVHEIVHPFMSANFPACPAWFNEGLASLYEQSGEREGHIIGRTNWRLKGLQRAIEENRLPTFDTLCHTTTLEFYADKTGTNYAQARYLCYHLQQEGLLVKYYHQFVKDAAKDPSGYTTLKAILGTDDMTAWQKDWEASVTRLRFPE